VTWWSEWIREKRLSWHAPVRKARKKLAKADREDLIEYALEVAAAAESKGDTEKMHRASYKFLRLGHYERAWELRMRAAELQQPSSIPEWQGEDLTDRKILVRAYVPKNRIGEELRLARFIAPVAQRAGGCIVVAEPRLVPLLRRSFAGVDVRARKIDDDPPFAEVDVGAYYETIAFHYAKTTEEMSRSFVPLRPDPTLVASIRQRYKLSSPGPLVGISWWSSNDKKVLPDLKDWAPLLSWESASFVSLQYGDIESDRSVLEKFVDGRLINDTSVNQLVDLDGFAAQIAALDAVVSISNTTIDMAGMLGVPTLHIRDDQPSAIWPQSGPSPWYPSMTFLYKQKRPWPDVFAEARRILEQMLPAPAR
jgi:hypothetical protein